MMCLKKVFFMAYNHLHEASYIIVSLCVYGVRKRMGAVDIPFIPC